MDMRPRHIVAAGAVAVASFVGFGALTAASAQEDDPSPSTTVEDEGSTDNPSQESRNEDCPDHQGNGRRGDHSERPSEDRGSEDQEGAAS